MVLRFVRFMKFVSMMGLMTANFMPRSGVVENFAAIFRGFSIKSYQLHSSLVESILATVYWSVRAVDHQHASLVRGEISTSVQLFEQQVHTPVIILTTNDDWVILKLFK